MDKQNDLNLFSNSRKNKLSRKQFTQQGIVYNSNKKIGSSKRMLESSISIAKNLGDQVKPSQAFTDIMKNILNMTTTRNKPDSQKNSHTQNNKEMASNKQNIRNRWKVDKINEQNHQDDEFNKQDKAAQTTEHLIKDTQYSPYTPTHQVSPQKLIIHQQPTAVYPQQFVHVRPVSMPKQSCPHLEHYPIPMSMPYQLPGQFPISYQRQCASPSKVMNYQPIIRQPQIHHPQHPRVVFVHPQPTPQCSQMKVIQNLPPMNMSRVLQPIYPQQRLFPKYSDPIQNNKVVADQPQPKVQNVKVSKSSKQIQKKPQKLGLSPEQFQQKMHEQYLRYDSKNDELLKQLSQLTEQQRKQQISNDLIRQLIENNKQQKRSSVKKVVKKVVNTQHITNQHNSYTEQHYQSFAALQVFEGRSFQAMIANGQAQTIGNSYYQTKQGFVFKKLEDGHFQTKQGYVFKQLQNGAIQTEDGQNISEHLQQIRQCIQNKKLQASENQSRPGSKKCMQANENDKIKNEQNYKIIMELFERQKQKMKQLNQKLENDFENMDEINKMNNHIADLDDLKDINKRQGMFFLKEIDQILDKYGSKSTQIKGKQKKQQSTAVSNFMSKVGGFFSKPNDSKFNKNEQPMVMDYRNQKQLSSTDYDNMELFQAPKKLFYSLFGSKNN